MTIYYGDDKDKSLGSKLLSPSHDSASPASHASPASLLLGLYSARAKIKDKDRSVIEMIKIKMKLLSSSPAPPAPLLSGLYPARAYKDI